MTQHTFMNKEQQKKLIVEIMNDDEKDGLYDQKKMTAVEWLADNINLKNSLKWELIVEEAKRMEKQQMMDVFHESRLTHPMIGFKHLTFEEYYNEEYGANK